MKNYEAVCDWRNNNLFHVLAEGEGQGKGFI